MQKSWGIYFLVGGLIFLSLCLCVGTLGGMIAFVMGQPESPAGRLPTPESVDSALAQQMQASLDSTHVPQSDPIDLARRFDNVDAATSLPALDGEPFEPGMVDDFWITNGDTNETAKIAAELAYVGEYVYFWVDTRVEYDPQHVEHIVETFERKSYAQTRALVGSEWIPGVDGDARLYVLYAKGLGFSVAGYFSSKDEYLSQVHTYSNAHEMFYLNADTMSLDNSNIQATLAHEFQHMIHWHLDRNEDTWLNEGFSELVQLLNGFGVGSFDMLYANDPDQALTHWPDSPGNAGAHYGQAFLFVTYFYDRFGRELTQALVAHPDNGLDSMDAVLAAEKLIDEDTGYSLTSDVVFRDWAVSLVVQDDDLADGRYGLPSYTSSLQPSFSEEITTCSANEDVWDVNQFGVDLIRIQCPGEHVLHFQGAEGVQVVPADPHSGTYALWSNRGDESHMMITRAFDFRQTAGPIELSYWTWFDLEEDYDYLYLTISEDGGENWQILRTPASTDVNPAGNAFGWGYNGQSGEGSQPIWIQEHVDLSSYAGQQVLLRFEYVTDAAVNGEGFMLDDVRIAAIDYEEGFEQDLGAWEASGFVRLHNRIPQTYQVALIERGDRVRVRPVSLDAEQRGQIAFEIGNGVQDAVLVVIGTAKHSWQPATYALDFSP